MSEPIDNQLFTLLMDKLETMDKRAESIESKVDSGFGKLNGRVRKLENWRWYIVGIATAIVFIVNQLLK